jgi:hypothetical protein
MENKNNNHLMAAMAAIAAMSTMQSIISASSIAATAVALQHESDEETVERKKRRYLRRSGTIPSTVECVLKKTTENDEGVRCYLASDDTCSVNK